MTKSMAIITQQPCLERRKQPPLPGEIESNISLHASPLGTDGVILVLGCRAPQQRTATMPCYYYLPGDDAVIRARKKTLAVSRLDAKANASFSPAKGSRGLAFYHYSSRFPSCTNSCHT